MRWVCIAGELERGEDPMKPARSPGADELWRAAFVLAVATGIASVVAALGYRKIPGLTLWQDVQLLLVAGATAGLLQRQRKTPSRAICAAAFLTVVAASLVTMTVNQHQLSLSGRMLLPLVGHKAALLAIAMIAPTIWLGSISIGLITLAVILQTRVFTRGALFPGEPLLTCLIAGVAVAVLVSRARGRAAERALALTRAEATSAERLATIFLAIRDLANTPLQTLELSTSLLELRNVADIDLVARMKRALAQLQRLDAVLLAEESRLHGQWLNLDSFDAWQELARRLGQPDIPGAPGQPPPPPPITSRQRTARPRPPG
jgi:hypothetical protein